MAAGHEDTFHHVRDFPYFELPQWLGGRYDLPLIDLFGYQLQLTKFMVLEVVAGVLALLIFGTLALKLRSGKPVRGAWWNFWETLVLFIRDDVVRPTIGDGGHHGHEEFLTKEGLLPVGEPHGDLHGTHGHTHAPSAHGNGGHAAAVAYGSHPADKFLPFICTCFFFILFCNLLGMIPWLGSPTGNINVTGALAICAFAFMLINGSKALGPVGFWKAQVPDMDVPGPLKYFLVPLVWLIEVAGLFIKHSVLAIRLFANIMAGHTVLGVLLAFIVGAAGTSLFYPVMAGSVFGQVFVSFLELLFAFIQAYVFAFLATVFVSMAVHPH
jgi:F-type H+-transporting ATPase subunit a